MRVIIYNDSHRKEADYYIKRAERLWGREDARPAPRSGEIFGRELTPLEAVQVILADVRAGGDEAVCAWCAKIDRVPMTPELLKCGEKEFLEARRKVAPEFLDALRLAKERIFAYHRKQLHESWMMREPGGTELGQRYVPLERAGLYVPGGTGGNTPLISTFLMDAIPALVAGVKEIAVCSPPAADFSASPHLLAAAGELGISGVFKAGGAQAIGAMAFGTATIPKVDKIVGPGNIFVTLAKRQVYGLVGLDLLAGPSEIVIVADGSANPSYAAADLLSQAEHDAEAGCLLITHDAVLAQAVSAEVDKQAESLPRAAIAKRALETNGAIIVTGSPEESIRLANEAAPEHLELHMADPEKYLPEIKHAGAVFLGGYSTEPIGDYVAGTNHVLPTNATARFSSALSVDDFMKKISVIKMSPGGFREIAGAAEILASAEGLEAHARAVRIRRQ
ncbi:MAG: histidinol dehydrogenase [Bacillota bacterium]